MTSQRSYEALRRTLLENWDPIGIRDVEAAQDEYDEYARHILFRLSHGASVRDVENYLIKIEAEIMGQTADRERARRVAGMLTSLAGEPPREG